MKTKHFSGFSFIVPVLLIILSSCSNPAGTWPAMRALGDVSDKVELVGNPLNVQYKDGTARVYARNIWDMHVLGSKLYFGGGNSSNNPPAVNAGPARIWSYSPSDGFLMEWQTTDEQIPLIREFDGELYVPGHDSRGPWGWTKGSFYRLEKESGTWKNYDTIPNAIHVYDVYKYNGALFAGIGPNNSTKGIQVSLDDGETWQDAVHTNPGGYISQSRIYCFLPLDGNLYVPGSSYVVYSGSGKTFSAPGATGYTTMGTYRPERAVVLNKYTVFITGIGTNDHQYLSGSLKAAKDITASHALTLPAGAVPRDLLVKGGRLFVLVTYKLSDNQYRNSVLSAWSVESTDVDWEEIFYFGTKTFARSFEYLDGAFYFGLGCDVWPGGNLEVDPVLPPSYLNDTGNILRYVYIR